MKGKIYLTALLLGCSLVAQAAYEGRVYVDANRNGRYDKGEKLLQGVCVSDGLNVVKTGKDGSFSLPGHARQRFVFMYSSRPLPVIGRTSTICVRRVRINPMISACRNGKDVSPVMEATASCMWRTRRYSTPPIRMTGLTN